MPSSIVAAVVSSAIGNAIGAYIGQAIIGKIIGAVIGAALSSAMSKKSSKSDLQSGARTVTIRQSISPWQIVYGETRAPGTITYIQSTSGNSHLHLVITYSGHACDSIDTLYFNEERVDFDVDGIATGRMVGFTYLERGLGDETTQPFPNLVAESGGQWTDAHRQAGRCKIHMKLATSRERFPNGVPNITALIRGKKVYDPRTGLTAWSDNPALILADYLCDSTFGLGHDYATEIDETLLTAAANICDELVTLADGSTEKRYTCNGVISSDEAPKDIIQKIVSSMMGWAVLIGGVWRIRAGAYITPTVTFTEDDFRGSIQVQTRLSRRDNFNAVKGVYTSPANLWQPTDFPPVTSSTYEAEDNDERVWKDVTLPLTDSGTMAQRIAKADLRKARQPITVIAPMKLSAYRVMPPETVMLTLSRFGWSAKVFEVLESKLVISDGIWGVDLVLRETASTVWDWSTSDEGVIDPAPNSDLPNPFDVVVPGIPTVSEELYETTGSAGVKVRALLSWTTEEGFVRATEVQYKATGDTTYIELPEASGESTTIDDITAGTYDFRIRTVNMFGARSEWVSVSAEIRGLTDPPADVVGFDVVASEGFALARWSRHADLDVRQGGQIVVKHSPLTTGATWNDGIIMQRFDGLSTSGLVSLVTGTYMAKAVDSSGRWSSTEATFVATEGMVSGYSTVDTVTEDPTFSGTKSNVAVISSKLQLVSGDLFDSGSGNFDDGVGLFDSGGMQQTSGTYTFGPMDMTTVSTRRFEAHISAQAVDNSSLFDDGQGLFDDGDGLFDGDEINDAVLSLYARTTDDDPAGSPTWSAWAQFHVADFTCRGVQFRLDFAVDSPAHNIEVSELAVVCKA